MGAYPSKLMSWEVEKVPIGQLQQQIIEYLASDDYLVDPYIYFDDIATHEYKSLEEFISKIPPSDLTEVIIHRDVMTPDPQLRMRYVVRNEPWKRGMLAKPILVLPNGNLATLQMDQPSFQQNMLTKAVTRVLTLFYPVRYFLQIVIPQKMLPGGSTTKLSYDLTALLPEKEHLRAYLQRPEDLAAVVIDDQAELLTNDESDGEIDDPAIALSPSPSPHTIEAINLFFEKPSVIPNDIEIPNDDDLEMSAATASQQPQLEEPFIQNGPIGAHKGIEGAYNSCYLDSLLFSMFYTTNIFDFLLQPTESEEKYARKTRRLLRQNVVEPLREIYYCDYESVMKLREHLSAINTDLMGVFMDAEQILYLLCEEVLKETQFIQYASEDEDGWGDFMHLMSIDPSDTSKVITAQKNVETSFTVNGRIKMASVPSPAFVLGMPRSNRELIHYEAVIPNTEINIKKLMETAECYNCADNADWEIQPLPGSFDSSQVQPVCSDCVPSLEENVDRAIVSRTRMVLISIICIRGVHFTAFVRTAKSNPDNGNNGDETEWYFFDSMAGGYPEVETVPNLEKWLKDVASDPDQFYTDDIPALVKRSLTDGHLCIYKPIYHENSMHLRD